MAPGLTRHGWVNDQCSHWEKSESDMSNMIRKLSPTGLGVAVMLLGMLLLH